MESNNFSQQEILNFKNLSSSIDAFLWTQLSRLNVLSISVISK